MTRNELIQDLVKKWIEKADKDLLTAERELSFKDPITETVCFHCQQAVEKYLKAYLVKHQIYFTKTHKIIELIELCSQVDESFRNELKNADSLTDYAVEVRYPDVSFSPSIEESKEAFEIANRAKNNILKKLTK
jgi:HEPN domain-containing protein